MTDNLPVRAAPPNPSLVALAVCSGVSEHAASPPDVISQGMTFLSGVYGSRFQPSPNALLAWLAVLEGCSAKDIAEAIVAHSKDTRERKDGSLYCDWPPTPGAILAQIKMAQQRNARLNPTQVRW